MTIASLVASFFTEKVPPKPQQVSDSGRFFTSMPSTARSSFSGRGPTFRKRIEWQVGW